MTRRPRFPRLRFFLGFKLLAAWTTFSGVESARLVKHNERRRRRKHVDSIYSSSSAFSQPSYPMHTPYFIRARKPLISSRGCYVSPNATDLPLSFRKRQEVVTRKSLLLELPGEDHPGIATTHPSLLELLNLHIGKKPRGAPFEARQAAIFPEQYYKGPGDGPPILARVVRKLGWGWYGKPSDEKEQFPCFFQLVVQDASYMGSEEVQVNIWNSLAVDLFLAIQLNDIIYIEDYKARTTKVGKEIMVNPGKYGSSLRIVDRELFFSLQVQSSRIDVTQRFRSDSLLGPSFDSYHRLHSLMQPNCICDNGQITLSTPVFLLYLFGSSDPTGSNCFRTAPRSTTRACFSTPETSSSNVPARWSSWKGNTAGVSCTTGSASSPSRPTPRVDREPSSSAWYPVSTSWRLA